MQAESNICSLLFSVAVERVPSIGAAIAAANSQLTSYNRSKRESNLIES